MVDVLGGVPGLEAIAVSRHPSATAPGFDAARGDVAALVTELDPDWVVNAIGVLRSRIDESDAASVAHAATINERFPHRLATACAGRRLIHLSTDAVFAGDAAPYDESATPDAQDPYGRAKAAGEPAGDGIVTVRCSVVGTEAGEPHSLLGWALSQPSPMTITGYTDARWNGLTSLALARVCGAVIAGVAEPLPSPLHLVPADSATKARLLELVLAAFGRSDVRVEPRPSGRPIDLTLATRHGREGTALWTAAGYKRAPTIAAMIGELARSTSGQRRARS